MSDLVIVVAITNPQAKSAAHGISLFLVENGMKGFIKGRKLHKIGFKAQVMRVKFFTQQYVFPHVTVFLPKINT